MSAIPEPVAVAADVDDIADGTPADPLPEGTPGGTPDGLASAGERLGRRAVRFDGLRLNGFKSFPDAAEIRIDPGLTGVVGPNGCGKSNLLEGLRWAMGETSARRMRGEGMDDMIFNGTEERPPRNVAEVAILLSAVEPEPGDPAGGRIEVARRIERGQGTRYRINGQDALQRTVQVLFQDNAVGASSAAIISQGRVTSLMVAKPVDRRGVLEDAAGVSGLNARRRESLSKIKGCEENLAKFDAELTNSGALLTTLRRQARQARRHREIGDRVREALALVLHLRHEGAVAAEAAAREAHARNEEEVGRRMLAVAAAERERAAAEAALAPIREARVAAEGRVARAEARIAGLAREAERVAQALSAARLRVIEATADGRRVEVEIAETEERARNYREERLALAAERAEEAEMVEAASEAAEAARHALAAAEARQDASGRALAEAEAGRKAAERASGEAGRRVEAASRRTAHAGAALAAALREDVDPGTLAAAEAAAGDAGEAASAAEEVAASAEEGHVAARSAEAAAEEAHAAARSEVARLAAERDGLRGARAAGGAAHPVIERLRVAPGNEAAVAGALGDAALAGTDPAEPEWWGGAGLPAAGGPSLRDVADGVPELDPFLSSVELVEPGRVGLPGPGRAWVTPGGDLTRWDGYRRRGGVGPVQAALERAARLRSVEADLAQAESVLGAAAARRDAARGALAAAREREATARAAARAAGEALRRSREELEGLRRRHAGAARTVEAARAAAAAAEAEASAAAAAAAAAEADLARLPPDARLRAEVEAARAGLVQARERESSARLALGRLTAESTARKSRIDQCVREEAGLARRVAEARERKADLAGRLEAARAAVEDSLAQQEALAESGVAAAQDEHDAARAQAESARDAETAGEARRTAADAAWREAEGAAGGLREERARLLAGVETAMRAREAAVAEIGERLGCAPGEALAAAALPAGDPVPALPAASARHERLERERASLGEINFLAEQELGEQESRFGRLETDRAELKETLGKLAQGLRRIEDEARSRLRDAFAQIDRHFGALFARLFNGGMAHLRLVGSEDLLEAGLEVYISPPGKRMQILSLFSGGEQALAAMALVFAAFVANPAPVCICDEIDAALDDVNVDALVSMMETMAEGDATRFLCITHRPLMMARMHRLYGVTMMEPGVTSVTRVDLDRAIEIAPKPERD